MVDFPAHSQQLESQIIDPDSLQQEVMTLLDNVNLLIADTKADLSDSDGLKYDRFQAQLFAMGDFANLELRMAIVAPMKAGKSTIINAILKEVSRIEVPSVSLSDREQKCLSNLIIINIPEPDEAGGLKLTAIVEEQLRHSLIVLDLTQLNSETAEIIKQQIKPIVESIGTNNLYVLINKIDRRRQGDLTPEQVKEFVIADLDSNAECDRVFEIAAPQCLSNFLSLSRDRLLSIRDDLNLRYQAITHDTDKLQQEIKVLESDLAYLESSRERLGSIAKF